MAKKDGEMDLVLNFEEAKKLVMLAIETQQPIMIHGSPGIGKSDMMRAIAKELGREFIDIRLPLYESPDIKGYPYLKETAGTDEKTLSFALTEELPFDDKQPDSNAIILFDEINGALPSTQLACYQLILDRAIGNKTLAKGVAMVAAGNRECDKGATSQMPKPLENRFLHAELTTTFTHWSEWAIEKGVNPLVVSYLAKNTQRLNAFDPMNSSRAFGTPRSWHKASIMLDHAQKTGGNDKVIRNVIASAVGTTVANEFMAFMTIGKDIPAPMEVLKGKAPKLKKAGVDVAYMVLTNCLYKIRELHEEHAREKNLPAFELTDELTTYTNNFFEYLLDNEDSLGTEFVVLPFTLITKNFKFPINQQKMPAIKKIMTKTKDRVSAAFKA